MLHARGPIHPFIIQPRNFFTHSLTLLSALTRAIRQRSAHSLPFAEQYRLLCCSDVGGSEKFKWGVVTAGLQANKPDSMHVAGSRGQCGTPIAHAWKVLLLVLITLATVAHGEFRVTPTRIPTARVPAPNNAFVPRGPTFQPAPMDVSGSPKAIDVIDATERGFAQFAHAGAQAKDQVVGTQPAFQCGGGPAQPKIVRNPNAALPRQPLGPEGTPAPLRTYNREPLFGARGFNESSVEPAGVRNAKPSVCPDVSPPLEQQLSRSQPSICRVYIWVPGGINLAYTLCTGTFIIDTHVATAGHCVAFYNGGAYVAQEVDNRFGIVCCSAQPDDTIYSCPVGYSFDIVGIVATCGYFRYGDQYTNNDGAVLKVQRPRNVAANVGVKMPFGQANPFCPTTSATYAGYPASSTRDFGCDKDWQGYLQKASTTASTYSCTGPVLPNPGILPGTVSFVGYDVTYRYIGNGCQGMSGGPLYAPDGTIFGLTSQGFKTCPGQRLFCGRQ